MGVNVNIEQTTDMGLVLFWIYHLDNPCGFEYEGKRVNVRPVYIKIVNRIIETHNFENPFAKEVLERKVREYS